MITTTQMYWLTRLDAINTLLTVLMSCSIGLVILSSIVIIGTLDDHTYDCIEGRKSILFYIVIPAIIIVSLLSLVKAFTPYTKEMAAIIVVPKIANSDKVQQAGNKLYDLAVEWMDAQKPKKKNGVK